MKDVAAKLIKAGATVTPHNINTMIENGYWDLAMKQIKKNKASFKPDSSGILLKIIQNKKWDFLEVLQPEKRIEELKKLTETDIYIKGNASKAAKVLISEQKWDLLAPFVGHVRHDKEKKQILSAILKREIPSNLMSTYVKALEYSLESKFYEDLKTGNYKDIKNVLTLQPQQFNILARKDFAGIYLRERKKNDGLAKMDALGKIVEIIEGKKVLRKLFDNKIKILYPDDDKKEEYHQNRLSIARQWGVTVKSEALEWKTKQTFVYQSPKPVFDNQSIKVIIRSSLFSDFDKEEQLAEELLKDFVFTSESISLRDGKKLIPLYKRKK